MIRNQSLFGQLTFGVGHGMKRSAGRTARAAERRQRDHSTAIVIGAWLRNIEANEARAYRHDKLPQSGHKYNINPQPKNYDTTK